jgi:uncharacterized protein YraI
MPHRRLLPGLLIALLAALGGHAAAAPAYVDKSVHLRAGPGRAYPIVAILPPRFVVEVAGCLRDYTWCDVIAGVDRGWVYAGNLRYPHEGRDVPIRGFGAVIGIGIVAFVLLDYWHDHYGERPWYGQRHRWVHPPPPPMPPPPLRPPPHRPAPPAPPPRNVHPGGPPGPGHAVPAPRPPPPSGRAPGPHPNPPVRREPGAPPGAERPGRPPGE